VAEGIASTHTVVPCGKAKSELGTVEPQEEAEQLFRAELREAVAVPDHLHQLVKSFGGGGGQ
jgi:hypothetical protein